MRPQGFPNYQDTGAGENLQRVTQSMQTSVKFNEMCGFSQMRMTWMFSKS